MSRPAYTKVKVYGQSHTGKVRKENQDSFLIMVPTNQKALEARGILFSVADGMGGHAAGKEASSLALETLVRHYYSATMESQKDCLLSAVSKAHQRIRMEAEANFDKRDMGTTLTAVVIYQNRAWIANVGDSRTYLIRNGKMTQMTVDHSVTNELGLVGEDAKNSAYRNQITRAVGVGRDVQADIFVEPLQEQDIFVLCSDGLTRHVSDKEILQIAIKKNPEKATRELIQLTNKRGAEDNVTVIIAKVDKIASPPASANSTQILNKKNLEMNPAPAKAKHVWMFLFFFSLLLYIISLLLIFHNEINAMGPKHDRVKSALVKWFAATKELRNVITPVSDTDREKNSLNEGENNSDVKSCYDELVALKSLMEQKYPVIQREVNPGEKIEQDKPEQQGVRSAEMNERPKEVAKQPVHAVPEQQDRTKASTFSTAKGKAHGAQARAQGEVKNSNGGESKIKVDSAMTNVKTPADSNKLNVP